MNTTRLLYSGWVDAWGEVDHSGDPGAGRIGCMVRHMAHLQQQEAHLLSALDSVRQSQAIAMKALDRFITENNSAPAPAGE